MLAHNLFILFTTKKHKYYVVIYNNNFLHLNFKMIVIDATLIPTFLHEFTELQY